MKIIYHESELSERKFGLSNIISKLDELFEFMGQCLEWFIGRVAILAAFLVIACLGWWIASCVSTLPIGVLLTFIIFILLIKG